MTEDIALADLESTLRVSTRPSGVMRTSGEGPADVHAEPVAAVMPHGFS